MIYPHDMIRTIARAFYIRASEYKHSGFDWTSMNDKWTKLSEEEKQIWYDISIEWLNSWKIQSPELYEYYLTNWIPDLNNDGYNKLLSVRMISI